MAFDWVASFTKENPGLLASDETVLAASQAQPKGEGVGRSSIGLAAQPPPTMMQVEGEASAWPHEFARDRRDPNVWTRKGMWYFLVVLTDKQIHAFELPNKGWRRKAHLGSDAGHFPFERISDLSVVNDGTWKVVRIVFKDGSLVELDVHKRNETFLDAIRTMGEKIQRSSRE